MVSDVLECNGLEPASPVKFAGCFHVRRTTPRPQRPTSGCQEDLQCAIKHQQHRQSAATAATETGVLLRDDTGGGTAAEKCTQGVAPHAPDRPNPFRGDSARLDSAWPSSAAADASAVAAPAAASSLRMRHASPQPSRAPDHCSTAVLTTKSCGGSAAGGSNLISGDGGGTSQPQSPRLEAINAFVRHRSTPHAVSLPPGTCRSGSLRQLRANSAGGPGCSTGGLDAWLPSGSVRSASSSFEEKRKEPRNWLRTGSAGSRDAPCTPGSSATGRRSIRSFSLRLRHAASVGANRLASLPATAGSPDLGRRRSSSSGGGAGAGCGAVAAASGALGPACCCQDALNATPAPLHLFKPAAPDQGEGSARAAPDLLPAGHRYQHILGLRSRFSNSVDVCLDTESGTPVAIRFLAHGPAADDAAVQQQLAFYHRAAGHPNIVQLLDVFALPGHLALVLQWANCGGLRAYVTSYMQDNGTGIPEADARRLMRQLLTAVQFAHENGCAASCIKLDDVLLHKDPDAPGGVTVKLLCGRGSGGDGASSPSATRAQGRLPNYFAPEVLRCRLYDAQCAAAWCCGVIMYMLLAEAFPFLTADEARDPPMAQLHAKVQRIVSGRFLAPARSVTPACSNLQMRLLDPDADLRITLEEALRHPWIAADPAAADPQVVKTLPDTQVGIPADWSTAMQALRIGEPQKPGSAGCAF